MLNISKSSANLVDIELSGILDDDRASDFSNNLTGAPIFGVNVSIL